MDFDRFEERVQGIVTACPELTEYERWLREQTAREAGSRDYLFSQPRPRFEPRKNDVVVAMPSLQIRERKGATKLCAGNLEVEVPLLTRRHLERLLECIDGKRCLLEVRWQSGVPADRFAAFLRATFGVVVFAPAAIERLEAQLSGVSIVRFACVPYAIERSYWENMIAVRQRLSTRLPLADTPLAWVTLLRELHVLALMGPRLDSFYRPASPGADRVVAPGVLLVSKPRLLRTPEQVIFLDGPRVNASLVGGQAYHQALYESVGDAEAIAPHRSFEVDGLPWGSWETARAEKDEKAAPWFCPPRPLREQHFESLRADLMHASEALDRGAADEVIEAAAGFHQSFVRLHPFHCANQSVAMNVVNAFLERSHGAGIPHLLLDVLALRLSRQAYARVLKRAVAAFSEVNSQPARRLDTLQHRTNRANALIERLAGGAQAQQLMQDDPDAARWALLSD